jgi:hypothetical protein
MRWDDPPKTDYKMLFGFTPELYLGARHGKEGRSIVAGRRA